MISCEVSWFCWPRTGVAVRTRARSCLASSMPEANAQYNIARPDSLAVRVAARVRAKMYRDFVRECGVSSESTILDVGVTSDQSYSSSNYLEALHPDKGKITACGIDDASFLERLYPGVRFVFGNGLELPFDDRSFDFVHSSAVLEHVGSFANQNRFVNECARVTRKGFFLTTPNRWFPIEFHTQLPLVHWLPKRQARKALKAIGLEFFAEEANLNLVSRSELRSIGRKLAGYRVRVLQRKLLGWPSNLMLVGERLAKLG